MVVRVVRIDATLSEPTGPFDADIEGSVWVSGWREHEEHIEVGRLPFRTADRHGATPWAILQRLPSAVGSHPYSPKGPFFLAERGTRLWSASLRDTHIAVRCCRPLGACCCRAMAGTGSFPQGVRQRGTSQNLQAVVSHDSLRRYILSNRSTCYGAQGQLATCRGGDLFSSDSLRRRQCRSIYWAGSALEL